MPATRTHFPLAYFSKIGQCAADLSPFNHFFCDIYEFCLADVWGLDCSCVVWKSQTGNGIKNEYYLQKKTSSFGEYSKTRLPFSRRQPIGERDTQSRFSAHVTLNIDPMTLIDEFDLTILNIYKNTQNANQNELSRSRLSFNYSNTNTRTHRSTDATKKTTTPLRGR